MQNCPIKTFRRSGQSTIYPTDRTNDFRHPWFNEWYGRKKWVIFLRHGGCGNGDNADLRLDKPQRPDKCRTS